MAFFLLHWQFLERLTEVWERDSPQRLTAQPRGQGCDDRMPSIFGARHALAGIFAILSSSQASLVERGLASGHLDSRC
jgi:hypothetical protein